MKRLRESRCGLDVITIERGSLAELAITMLPLPGESAGDLMRRLAGTLGSRGARVLKLDVFGARSACAAGLEALWMALGEDAPPVTWVEGAPCSEGAIAGLQAHAVSGAPVENVRLGGRTVGRAFEDRDARYVFFGDLCSAERDVSRARQTRLSLEMLEAALQAADMSFYDVVRTWFYNDDILDWYDAFNQVRNDFFAERRVFERFMPASTGIGAMNAAGSALVAGALAVKPKREGVVCGPVASLLQGSPHDYGSSFSRAVRIAAPDCRRVLISGTASIEPEGRTAHVGDVDAQVALTMRIVGAILESNRMSLADVTRAVAYFKRASDAAAMGRWAASTAAPGLPLVVTEAVVCRDELLFEIELDAVAAS